jgi:hypothetical protein
MERRAAQVRLWLLLGLVAAVIVTPLAEPLWRAWTCYQRHDAGERATAEVIGLYPGGLTLQLTSGPHRDAPCTAKASETAGKPGETLRVVYLADRSECVSQATVERSGAVLWALTSGLACVLLLIALVGLVLQRALRAAGIPQRALPVDPDAVACPACGGKMAEGYLLLLAGLHWREPGEPVGLPSALGGLPGTVGWRGRPRLHALRCTACEILTAQYGLPRSPH